MFHIRKVSGVMPGCTRQDSPEDQRVVSMGGMGRASLDGGEGRELGWKGEMLGKNE